MIRGRELVKTCIASILDHPSVYMGGPTLHNKRRADKILELLEGWGYRFEEFEYEPNGQIITIRTAAEHGADCPVETSR